MVDRESESREETRKLNNSFVERGIVGLNRRWKLQAQVRKLAKSLCRAMKAFG